MSIRLFCLPLLLVGLAALGAASPAASAQRCEITLSVDGAVALGALKARVGYGAVAGEFPGSEDGVECVALAPGAYAAARDDDAGRELSFGMVSALGVSLPADFWRCTFDSDGEVPDAAGFTIAVDEALTPEGAPTSATLAIDEIACHSQAICGNGIVEEGEQCDFGSVTLSCDSSCTLTRDTLRCAVGFHVAGVGLLGGIQFIVDYAGVNGEFEGSGVGVSCSEALASGLTAVDDRELDEELRLAFISATGLALPVDLWNCAFVTNAVPLLPQNFQIQNVVATDVLAAAVPVDVTAVVGECIYGPYCGDGTVDPTEACDDGNRIAGDACTNTCQFAVCGDGVLRSGVEQCDDGNSISGDCCSSSCGFESAATVCRVASGVCDLAETCTGSSGNCPADAKSTSVCRVSSEACDAPESCNGISSACPADGFAAAGTSCRASAGDCDLAETCTGSSASCPADVKSTSVCRTSAGTCDLAESCNGTSDICPTDGFVVAGTGCRGSAGDCDLAETCTGSSASCPSDVKSTSVCRVSSAPCDAAESCNGISNACPADVLAVAGTSCRASAGDCDLAETCTGSSAGCPADVKKTSVCRTSTGTCDLAESCNGTSDACPADGFVAAGTGCRGSAGACDLAETCTGSSASCPVDVKSTSVCRVSSGACDAAESCNGISNVCPADVLAAAGTGCRASAGDCDLAETCTGSSANCPADVKSTAVCRTSAGICDLAESCNGTSAACPADGFVAAGTGCRGPAGACDLAETCTGSSASCPADIKSTSVCRASSAACDAAESCNGISNACPADVLSAAGTSCRASAGDCDLAETCTGSSATCPADVKKTSLCRASSGECDVAEACNGSSVDCPSDAFRGAGFACTTDANSCTTDQCDGSGSCGHTANSAPCNDGLFCNGTDTCAAGACGLHTGSPCPGPDLDANCRESCAESTDTCTANDPEASGCDDGSSTTSNDQCLGGSCVGSSGTILCGDADANGSIGAADALRVLRAAVGQAVDCPIVRCDTDDSGNVSAPDALRVLKKAVGLNVDLTCPA